MSIIGSSKQLGGRLIRRLLGEQALGLAELILLPIRRDDLGGPFNGQRQRQALFQALASRVDLASIVETGTYRGTTTEYMYRETSLPVHSVELNPRHYRFAKTRLSMLRGIRVYLGDSRRFLEQLAEQRLLPAGVTFFYLDGHWNADLPLWEEIDSIFANWPSALLMIDDFQVPEDEGYGYDDYGPRRALTVDCLHSECGIAAQAAIFLPTSRSDSETGAKRGCVVLTADAEIARRLRSISLLSEYRREALQSG